MKDNQKRKVRFNTRLPADLLQWSKKYAASKNTTVTQIISDLLTSMKEKHDD